jgi:hypothetical protein
MRTGLSLTTFSRSGWIAATMPGRLQGSISTLGFLPRNSPYTLSDTNIGSFSEQRLLDKGLSSRVYFNEAQD